MHADVRHQVDRVGERGSQREMNTGCAYGWYARARCLDCSCPGSPGRSPNLACLGAGSAGAQLCRAAALSSPSCPVPVQGGGTALASYAFHRDQPDRDRDDARQGAPIHRHTGRRSQHDKPDYVLPSSRLPLFLPGAPRCGGRLCRSHADRHLISPFDGAEPHDSRREPPGQLVTCQHPACGQDLQGADDEGDPALAAGEVILAPCTCRDCRTLIAVLLLPDPTYFGPQLHPLNRVKGEGSLLACPASELRGTCALAWVPSNTMSRARRTVG